MNICISLEYDGADFSGWQVQPGQRTVQGEVETALHRLCGKQVRIHGSGRTDTGVHALGQVASFGLETTVPPGRMWQALNSLLPSNVRVTGSWQVPADFHARYSAVAKTYKYRVLQAPYVPPLLRKRVWVVRDSLNLAVMEAGLSDLLGTHDFQAFCASGSSVQTTARTVSEASIEHGPDGTIDLTVSADGFLYNMVRIIAAAAVNIGAGRAGEDIFRQAITTGRRELMKATAPPQGLYLMRVYYPPEYGIPLT